MWFRYSYRKMVKLFANSGDPDQMPYTAASNMGLHKYPFEGLQTKMGSYYFCNFLNMLYILTLTAPKAILISTEHYDFMQK